MHLRVLIVESEPEEAMLLQDVLTEVESGRHWSTWVRIETSHAETLAAAAAILASEVVDVILLSLDAGGADRFRQLQAAAGHIPVILLIAPEDDTLAIRLVREGAQDFLIKSQVDCAPLAHAMRNALERHRLLNAARAGASIDSLTGLPNRSAFLAFAEHDRRLSEILGRRLMVLVAEPRCTADPDPQQRDLIMVEAADGLRGIARATDLLARIGASRFAVSIVDCDSELVEEAWARMHSGAAGLRIQIGAAILSPGRAASVDDLLEQAARDLAPSALAMRR